MKKLRGGWTQSTFTHWAPAKTQRRPLHIPLQGGGKKFVAERSEARNFRWGSIVRIPPIPLRHPEFISGSSHCRISRVFETPPAEAQHWPDPEPSSG